MAEISYELTEGVLSPLLAAELRACWQTVFDAAEFDLGVLSVKPRALIAAARFDGAVGGFKIGYEERPGRFYSWLGGVRPEFRGRGIARELMRLQHDWCRRNGYSEVRTKTKNTWKAMLILNLRAGFDIIGSYTDECGEPKLILKKLLGGEELDLLTPEAGSP